MLIVDGQLPGSFWLLDRKTDCRFAPGEGLDYKSGPAHRQSQLKAAHRICRRQFLQSVAGGLGGLCLDPSQLGAAVSPTAPAPVFAQRGYYITFMRMPTYGLAAWKKTIDQIHEDGANLLLLWMAGAFRSKKFPVTWKFNAEHENVRHDFGRQLVAYAHRRGIRVLLGFTPFGYDGVNQYPLERPDLKARKSSGEPTDKSGIFCWGWNLCPSKPDAQTFMLEYVREMLFEFYPEADGLMIESSDYAICHCPECRGHFFEREFDFVQGISREVWARNPASSVVVYPHYFSGTRVPGFNVTAATRPFDPRWTLFFTPHSAHLDSKLIQQARASLWWDEAPALHDPAAIQRGAQKARQAGVTGYVPSLEAYSFVPTEAEEGQKYLVGRRQVPLGFGWLKPDEMPFGELPMRVNRLAYRAFARAPDLAFDEFKQQLGQEIFGPRSDSQAVDDLLAIQRYFAHARTWCQASPIVTPARVQAMRNRGELKPEKAAEYRAALAHIAEIEKRHQQARARGERDLHRIAKWILQQWNADNRRLLAI